MHSKMEIMTSKFINAINAFELQCLHHYQDKQASEHGQNEKFGIHYTAEHLMTLENEEIPNLTY